MAAYVTSQPYMYVLYSERESEHVITVDIGPGRQQSFDNPSENIISEPWRTKTAASTSS